jgi:ATP-dependent RNA helicase DOB1
MNSNDLFSFLDETQEGNDSDHDEPMDVETNPPAINKRKAETVLGADQENIQVSAPKKQRLSSPKPVVLDDFETEAKREVAASAGLTGVAETGSRLELKHQVCRPENLHLDEA